MAKRYSDKRARQNKHVDLSKRMVIKTEDFLFDLLDKNKEPFLLILDGVQDPHNLGACMRTADAAGVDAVIAPSRRAVSMTDTVRKIACGANVPFVRVTNLVRVMTHLREAGVRLVGTSDTCTQSIYDVDLERPVAIVLGAEEKGIRRLTRETCDDVVQIPMAGTVSCLNVSVATGVCLFEAVRQQR